MALNGLLESIIDDARAQGRNPALVTMSPDVYRQWQKRNGSVEPVAVGGLPIEIRDNYKPKTILLLGQITAGRSRYDFPNLPADDLAGYCGPGDEEIVEKCDPLDIKIWFLRSVGSQSTAELAEIFGLEPQHIIAAIRRVMQAYAERDGQTGSTQ